MNGIPSHKCICIYVQMFVGTVSLKLFRTANILKSFNILTYPYSGTYIHAYEYTGALTHNWISNLQIKMGTCVKNQLNTSFFAVN